MNPDNLPLASTQNHRLEFNRGESLAFQQIERGRVAISWALPESVRMAAKGNYNICKNYNKIIIQVSPSTTG
jgi:hypothetical protein